MHELYYLVDAGYLTDGCSNGVTKEKYYSNKCLKCERNKRGHEGEKFHSEISL